MIKLQRKKEIKNLIFSNFSQFCKKKNNKIKKKQKYIKKKSKGRNLIF